MKRFTFVLVALIELSFFSFRAQAQTSLDSIRVMTDESAPAVKLATNDSQPLSGIRCHAIRIHNQSSHNIVVSNVEFYCGGLYSVQYIRRLDMTNICVTKGTTLLGKLLSWSYSNNYSSFEISFPNPVNVPSHGSVVVDLKADLYGWGSYNFYLDRLTVTDLQTYETKIVYCNAGSKDIVLANADHMSMEFSVYPRGWNPVDVDTLYVLPGEYFYSSGYFNTDNGNYIEKSITAIRTGVNISPNLAGFSGVNFSHPWLYNLGELGHVTFDSTALSRGLVWTANSTASGIDGYGLAWFSGYNNLALGEIGYVNSHAAVVFFNHLLVAPRSDYAGRNRTVLSIDGILGDFDGNNSVTIDEVNYMQDLYTTHGGFTDYYQYTKDGYNVGRTAILFDGSTLIDIWLLRVWLNNHNDPLVKNLGIGQLMSQRVRPTTTSYSQTVVGNTVKINTRGFAVRISAVLPNGKLWSNAAMVNNNQAVFTVPDQTLQYRVEAVTLPGSTTDVEDNPNIPVEFNLNQNYPNPFNPATTISYALPVNGFVTLKVYDILGKEVVMLVNEEKQAGRYAVNFDASNLASGTYIYRLTAGSSTQIKKMILMK